MSGLRRHKKKMEKKLKKSKEELFHVTHSLFVIIGSVYVLTYSSSYPLLIYKPMHQPFLLEFPSFDV